jgi:hypothetical protein
LLQYALVSLDLVLQAGSRDLGGKKWRVVTLALAGVVVAAEAYFLLRVVLGMQDTAPMA